MGHSTSCIVANSMFLCARHDSLELTWREEVKSSVGNVFDGSVATGGNLLRHLLLDVSWNQTCDALGVVNGTGSDNVGSNTRRSIFDRDHVHESVDSSFRSRHVSLHDRTSVVECCRDGKVYVCAE